MKRILSLVIISLCFISTFTHAQEGQRVFQENCSHCHAPGMNNPGTQQLTKTRGEENGILEERDNLVDFYVKTIVRQGLKGMPAFKPTQVTERQLDLLAAYLTD